MTHDFSKIISPLCACIHCRWKFCVLCHINSSSQWRFTNVQQCQLAVRLPESLLGDASGLDAPWWETHLSGVECTRSHSAAQPFSWLVRHHLLHRVPGEFTQSKLKSDRSLNEKVSANTQCDSTLAFSGIPKTPCCDWWWIAKGFSCQIRIMGEASWRDYWVSSHICDLLKELDLGRSVLIDDIWPHTCRSAIKNLLCHP